MDQRIERLEALVMGHETKIETLRDIQQDQATILNGSHSLNVPSLRNQMIDLSAKLDDFENGRIEAIEVVMNKALVIAWVSIAMSTLSSVMLAIIIIVELSK